MTSNGASISPILDRESNLSRTRVSDRNVPVMVRSDGRYRCVGRFQDHAADAPLPRHLDRHAAAERFAVDDRGLRRHAEPVEKGEGGAAVPIQPILGGTPVVAAVTAPTHQQHPMAGVEIGAHLAGAMADMSRVSVEVDQRRLVRVARRRVPGQERQAVIRGQPRRLHVVEAREGQVRRRSVRQVEQPALAEKQTAGQQPRSRRRRRSDTAAPGSPWCDAAVMGRNIASAGGGVARPGGCLRHPSRSRHPSSRWDEI